MPGGTLWGQAQLRIFDRICKGNTPHLYKSIYRQVFPGITQFQYVKETRHILNMQSLIFLILHHEILYFSKKVEPLSLSGYFI